MFYLPRFSKNVYQLIGEGVLPINTNNLNLLEMDSDELTSLT